MKYLFFSILFFCFTVSCKKNSPKSELINPEYDKAYSFDTLKIHDSAYIYYGKALENFKQKKDNFGEAKCLLAMAKILDIKGNYFKAQDFSLKAKTLFNINDKNQFYHISDNFNNLGGISNNLKKYNEAKEYYKYAMKYAETEDVKIIFIANIAKIYKEEKKYSQAIKIYDSIAPILKKKDTFSYARVLSNLSYIKWLENNSYNLEPLQSQALEIQKRINDKMGQNASYSHLADYFKTKDLKKALLYANKMYQVAKDVNSSDDQLESLQKITAFDSQNYISNFNQYISLRDSVQNARNIDSDKFATVVYGVEEGKVQNQILKTQSFKQIVGIAALVIALISVFFWNEKRKKHIRQEKEKEKELEVKNTELRYSKKVHDVVANGLYHLMIDIENKPEINKVKILNDMEKMYEESRDISHDRITEIDFHERFGKMMNSYYTEEQKVIPIKYVEKIWEMIPQNTQSELFYVVREILVNMKKHSDAKMVVLKFEREGDALHITYTDNGKGIKNLDSQRGAGIKNTENRIDTIGGDIIFEENPNGGLIIKITIPTHSKYV